MVSEINLETAVNVTMIKFIFLLYSVEPSTSALLYLFPVEQTLPPRPQPSAPPMTTAPATGISAKQKSTKRYADSNTAYQLSNNSRGAQ